VVLLQPQRLSVARVKFAQAEKTFKDRSRAEDGVRGVGRSGQAFAQELLQRRSAGPEFQGRFRVSGLFVQPTLEVNRAEDVHARQLAPRGHVGAGENDCRVDPARFKTKMRRNELLQPGNILERLADEILFKRTMIPTQFAVVESDVTAMGFGFDDEDGAVSAEDEVIDVAVRRGHVVEDLVTGGEAVQNGADHFFRFGSANSLLLAALDDIDPANDVMIDGPEPRQRERESDRHRNRVIGQENGGQGNQTENGQGLQMRVPLAGQLTRAVAGRSSVHRPDAQRFACRETADDFRCAPTGCVDFCAEQDYGLHRSQTWLNNDML
jgi:hypothetical protein